MRLVGLCCFRDAAQHLPALALSLEGYLDGVIWCDDASQDGSAACVESNPFTLDVIKVGNRSNFGANEVTNRLMLLEMARRHKADWLLCFDADFRFERKFLDRLREIISASESKPVVWLKLRDLWNSPDQYRVDGVWGKKELPLLFPRVPFNRYHERGTLHTQWVPPWLQNPTLQTHTDWNVYHLGSISEELRQKRVETHNLADPERKWQGDYNYLGDETGLQVERIPDGRGFE